MVGALVISKDRKVFQIGTSKGIFLGSSRFTDQFPRKEEAIAEFMGNSTSDVRCTGSNVSSLDQNIKSLQQERNVTSFSFQLTNTQREVQRTHLKTWVRQGIKKHFEHHKRNAISCTFPLDDSCSEVFGLCVRAWQALENR